VKRSVNLFEAILPLMTMLVCFVAATFVFPMSAALLIVIMLIAATVAALIAIRQGHDWEEIQRATGKRLASVLPALLILLSIGMLIGTWMYSGTIPTLVYYGVQMINPQYMVLTAFLATALMSLTGSSFASAATIGVALMGVAAAMGAPLHITAGAIISGAYFGDKMSPLSDLTNICAIGAGADLYDHIRNMIYTAGPSFVVALIVYFFAGGVAGDGAESLSSGSQKLLRELEQVYQLNWIALSPALVVLYGTFRRKPAALTMVGSSLVALGIGIVVQDFGLNAAVLSAISGFDLALVVDTTAPALEPSSTLTLLLNRGGVNSMSNTLILIIAAFLLAAAMDVSGSLEKLLLTMLQRVRSVFGLVLATMVSGSTMIALTSHGGVTALIVGGLFQDAYRDQGLAPENLSRSLEDSATIISPLLPWTVSGIFMATTLGVATVDYAPWAIFCITGPMFSLLLAATYTKTGFGLKKLRI
jgi:NhaC family Na+:H+ antiporter